MTAVSNVERLIAHLRVPLYRNGYALVANSGISAVLGVIFWAIAARIYGPETVGLNSAAISTMISLSFLSQLNMANALNRFLPTAGRASPRLILIAYALCVGVALVVSTVFVAGIHVWTPDLALLKSSWWISGGFVAGTMLWTIFALQDGAMVGLREAIWLPVETLTYASAKLALLAPFALLFPKHGIYVAWTLPVIVMVLLVNLLLFRRLIPAHVRTTAAKAEAIVPKSIARYVTGDYLSSLIGWAVNLLLPLMVIAQAGAAANAYFALAWTVTYALYLVSLNMGMSLITEAVTEPTRLYYYVRQTLLQGVRLIVPVVLVTELIAPYFLSFFGESYVTEGTLLLRLLCLSALPHIINALYISLARVKRNMRTVMLLQAATNIQALILAYLLLPRMGVVGIGYAWLISQSTVAVLVSSGVLRGLGCPSLTAILQAKELESSA